MNEIDEKYKPTWPVSDLNFLKKETFNIVIQIEGKKRGLILSESEITEEQLIKKIKEDLVMSKFIKYKKIKKCIYIKNKLINLIIE